jgi:hypothetical protein
LPSPRVHRIEQLRRSELIMETFQSQWAKRRFDGLSDTVPQGAAFHRRRVTDLRAVAETIEDTEARIGVLRLAEYHEKAADTLERLSPERR